MREACSSMLHDDLTASCRSECLQQIHMPALVPMQVEHPVTEWISNTNIPSIQMMIGMGFPLWRIPEIRHLYQHEREGTSPIDFEIQQQRPPESEQARNNLISHFLQSVWCWHHKQNRHAIVSLAMTPGTKACASALGFSKLILVPCHRYIAPAVT